MSSGAVAEHGKQQQTKSRLAGMEGTGEPGQKTQACPKTPAVECIHHPYNICTRALAPQGKVLPSDTRPSRALTAPNAAGVLSKRKEAAPL